MLSALRSKALAPAAFCRKTAHTGSGKLVIKPSSTIRAYQRSNTLLEESSSSSKSGFQSGAAYKPKSMQDRMKSVDSSSTWRQYANSVLELVLMFGCLGFAFATSLRASHHQTVHDEEIEALNYELVEAEEDLERIKENWKRIEQVLKTEAAAGRKGELLISLDLVQQLSQKHLFSPTLEGHRLEKKAEKEEIGEKSDSNPTPLLPAPIPLLPFNPNERVFFF